MNYIGRKAKLFDEIKSVVLEQSLEFGSFCDLFAGTGYVGANMKPYFNKVISNDFEYYAYILNKHYVENNITQFDDAFPQINSLEPIKGLIYNNYCSPANRLYFSDHNGQKIDAIRQYIEKFKDDSDYYFFLLTSLLEAVDRIQNTAGIYAAFFKSLKDSAKKEIELKPEYMEVVPGQENDIYNEDAQNLIKEISGDVLYLDPPYNRRQYGSNYHLLNTIAKYSLEGSKLTEVTGLPKDYKKSKMCYKDSAYEMLIDILEHANFKDIFISYNNEGLLAKEVLSLKDIRDIYYFDYKRYKADNNRSNKDGGTIEYLIHIRKQ